MSCDRVEFVRVSRRARIEFLRPAMDDEGSEARARRVDATNAALRGFQVSATAAAKLVVVDQPRRREAVTTWGYTVVSMNPSGAVDAWTRGSSGLVPEVIANGVNRLNRALSPPGPLHGRKELAKRSRRGKTHAPVVYSM